MPHPPPTTYLLKDVNLPRIINTWGCKNKFWTALEVVGIHITNAHCHPCQGELNPLVWPHPFAPLFNSPFAVIDHVVNKNNRLLSLCVNHDVTRFIHFLLVNPDRCINGMPISCPQIWWVHSPMPKSLSMKQSHGQRVLNCQLSRKMGKVKVMYLTL